MSCRHAVFRIIKDLLRIINKDLVGHLPSHFLCDIGIGISDPCDTAFASMAVRTNITYKFFFQKFPAVFLG